MIFLLIPPPNVFSQIWSMLGLCWSRHHSLPCHRSSLQVSFYKNLPLAGLQVSFYKRCVKILSAFNVNDFFQTRHLLLLCPWHWCEPDHWQILRPGENGDKYDDQVIMITPSDDNGCTNNVHRMEKSWPEREGLLESTTQFGTSTSGMQSGLPGG